MCVLGDPGCHMACIDRACSVVNKVMVSSKDSSAEIQSSSSTITTPGPADLKSVLHSPDSSKLVCKHVIDYNPAKEKCSLGDAARNPKSLFTTNFTRSSIIITSVI